MRHEKCPDKKERVFKCRRCDKVYEQRYYLQKHERKIYVRVILNKINCYKLTKKSLQGIHARSNDHSKSGVQKKLDSLVSEAVCEDKQPKRATVIIEYEGKKVRKSFF